MNRQSFAQTGRSSLAKTKPAVEVPNGQLEKAALDSFKASTNLNRALFQERQPTKTNRMLANTAKDLLKEVKLVRELQKHLPKQSEDAELEAEVAALNHYRPPPANDNTKTLVDKIVTNRRAKHISTLQEFEADLSEYMSSVRDIYAAVKSEAEEFIKINDQDVSDYCARLTDDYLMANEKEIVRQIESVIRENSHRRNEKMITVRNNLSSSERERTERIDSYCKALINRLVESAFVLEEEATRISDEWKTKLNDSQTADNDANKLFAEKLEEQQQAKFQQLRVELTGKQARWKQLKQESALEEFKRDVFLPEYCNSSERKRLYGALRKQQQKVHEERKALIEELSSMNPSQYTKAGVDKWLDKVKALAEENNAAVDKLVAELVRQGEAAKRLGERRLEQLRNRLNYIEMQSPEENEKTLEERSIPLLESNIQQGKKLLSDVAGYVEKYDSRENDVCENLAKFMLKLGQKNDDNKKAGEVTQQSYELSKAKVADQDEEKVEKLNGQLESLKKELKESLHHIKLEEMEKKCFDKIDELEQQYRATHDLNKQLAADHPKLIEKDMQKAESDAAEVFRLYDESRKAELIEKNKKEAEQRILKRIEVEDRKKAEEEARQAEETKKKTGKAPPPAKPKDPKKAASQLEERKQALLKELGPNQIKQFKTASGKTWLIYQTIDELAAEMYLFSEEKKEGEPAQAAGDDAPAPPADQVEPAIRDCQNIQTVEQNVMFKKDYVAEKLTVIRDRMFSHIGEQKQLQLGRASDNDKDFLEVSLEELDRRLNEHYSLKGKLESEVYVRRASEITSHKKMYERHARTTKEKMDTQTQKFNFLLEKSLQLMKLHSEEQKKVREELPSAKNLSQLQGMAGRNRQNSQRFGLEVKEILNELQRLSTMEVEHLISKNEQFLKECKEMSNGGDYSKEQLQWYGQMMKEITTQLEQQKLKRAEKMNEIEVHTSKKKQEFLDAFDKEYNLCVEELAAKDCSGKKYGKPKRYAQERVRGQMAKCEQAQLNLDKMLEELAAELEVKSIDKPSSLEIRRRLMTIRSCIARYAKHIDAFRPDTKLQEMPRVNYNETRCDTALSGPAELQEDEKRKQAELEALGQLSQQKDDKKFSQQIEDIEKVMKEEAQKLYVGDKAKYLTGADKIPDFLRDYIANMKKNAESFRLNSIRDLRASCAHLVELSERITRNVIQGLTSFYGDKRRKETMPEFTSFRQLQDKMEQTKNEHTKKLRPNLVNPACAQQLADLDATEKKRLAEFREAIKKSREQILDGQFKTSSVYLTAILNNFEFLLQYYDSMILEEDFIKLPGDENKEKKHLNLKELMLLKQKGQTFDANSERNVTKKWPGISYNMFDCPNRKFEYVKTAIEEPKVDPKKGGKKEGKDPKQPPPAQEAQPGVTKDIQSIKTQRQKTAFEERNRMLEQFKKDFDRDLQMFLKEFEAAEKNEQKYESRWNETVEGFKKAK